MGIASQVIQQDFFSTYSGYVILAISILVGVIGWGIRTLLRTLHTQNTVLAAQSQALAILVKDTARDRLDVVKYHDEIIDHKKALHELDIEKTLTREQIGDIVKTLDRHNIH